MLRDQEEKSIAAGSIIGQVATDDTLLDGRVILRQPAVGYRVAVDPVLLAAAVPAAAGERVLEAGIGSGAASLCLAVRVPGLAIVGLERQPELAALARENVALNGLAERIAVMEGDLAAPPSGLGRDFDHAIANPPFAPAGTPSPHASRQAAHGEADLGAWLDFCLRRLRPGGRIALIHRADSLDRVVAGLVGRAGDIEIVPLWPRAGVPARRVVVRARKGARGPARLHPGLVLHGEAGFTPEALAVLRDGAALAPPPQSS